MTPEQRVTDLLSPMTDAAAAFDDLVAAGPAAIPALRVALARGRGIPQLTAVLSAIDLADPVAALAPLLDELDDVRDAAIRALAAHRDPRALPLLVGALASDRFTAAEALGELGCSEAVAPLLAAVRSYVGEDGAELPAADALRSASRCLDLRLVLTVATALAKLGQPRLAGAAIHLATLRDDREHADANLVRAAAVRALYHIVAPGVAPALHRAALDPDDDTARAALLGMLYLGRRDEAEAWLAIAASGSATAKHAAWCLERWSGDRLPCDDDGRLVWSELQRWWAAAQRRFGGGACYRSGAPIDIAALIDVLPEDPRTLRAEITLRTGAPALQPLLTGHPVSAGELSAIRAWWRDHASRFPPGKLHCWGRTFEPGAVDA